MDRNGVEQATLVQMLGVFDNNYQQECVSRYSDRFSSVVAVDVRQADAVEKLSRLAESGAIGVRLRPTDRSPGVDPYAIWRAADRLGLFVSCVGNSLQFSSTDFSKVVAEFPSMPILLEHFGGTSSPDLTEEAKTLRSQVFQLNVYKNVILKIHGLGEIATRDQLMIGESDESSRSLPQTLVDAIQSFGNSRLVWGSDFPVVSSREGYANALKWSHQAIEKIAPDAVSNILGLTAKTLLSRTWKC